MRQKYTSLKCMEQEFLNFLQCAPFFTPKKLAPLLPASKTCAPLLNDSKKPNPSSITGFPELLVDRYPLDTVAGLHVPSKFCDVSLKKKRLSVRISH